MATPVPSGALMSLVSALLLPSGPHLHAHPFLPLVVADSKQLVTGSADTTAKLWDVETGKELFSFQHKTSVRACGFSLGGRELFVVTDKQMGNPAQILVYDIARTVDQRTFPSISCQPHLPSYFFIPFSSRGL